MTSINTISSTENSNKYKNIALGTTGAIIGWEAEPYIRRALFYPTRKYISETLPERQNGEYKAYIDKALEEFPYKKIHLFDINEKNSEEILKKIGLKFEEPSLFQKIKKHILRQPNNRKKFIQETIEGKNALYNGRANLILCNCEKHGSAFFHELGHAYNSNTTNKAIKLLTAIRTPLAVLFPPAISLAAMLTNPKPNGEITDSADFIKKYCGPIASLCTLPLMAEECLASYKGYKIAKNMNIPTELLQKVKKSAICSGISYSAGLICLGLAVQSASKIRDIICKPIYDNNRP